MFSLRFKLSQYLQYVLILLGEKITTSSPTGCNGIFTNMSVWTGYILAAVISTDHFIDGKKMTDVMDSYGNKITKDRAVMITHVTLNAYGFYGFKIAEFFIVE